MHQRIFRRRELMAGSSLEDFFNRFVRGKEELDYNARLRRDPSGDERSAGCECGGGSCVLRR